MKKFRFREFQVYKDTICFRRDLKDLSNKVLPKEERFALLSQLWRALDSIVLNIEEGADRSTDKDFARFLNNAHTSLNEVVASLDLMHSDMYITLQELDFYLKEAEKVGNQITAFRKSLLNEPTK